VLAGGAADAPDPKDGAVCRFCGRLRRDTPWLVKDVGQQCRTCPRIYLRIFARRGWSKNEYEQECKANPAATLKRVQEWEGDAGEGLDGEGEDVPRKRLKKIDEKYDAPAQKVAVSDESALLQTMTMGHFWSVALFQSEFGFAELRKQQLSEIFVI
jgi:hypothetical protein